MCKRSFPLSELKVGSPKTHGASLLLAIVPVEEMTAPAPCSFSLPAEVEAGVITLRRLLQMSRVAAELVPAGVVDNDLRVSDSNRKSMC